LRSTIALTLALGATFAPNAWADPAPLPRAEAAIAARSQVPAPVRSNPDEQTAGHLQTGSPSSPAATLGRPNPDQQGSDVAVSQGVVALGSAGARGPGGMRGRGPNPAGSMFEHTPAPPPAIAQAPFHWGDAAIG